MQVLLEFAGFDYLEWRIEVQDDVSWPLEIVDVHGETAALSIEVGHVDPLAVSPLHVVAVDGRLNDDTLRVGCSAESGANVFA